MRLSSKGAVLALTRVMAVDDASGGVRVNASSPAPPRPA
jgi:NAD(P)-dependent dehydrogenase (short-subunit alcohol dehydrogenase family)